MSIDIKRGDVIHVPCRWCGKSFLKYRVEEATVQLHCPTCNQVTVVRAKADGEVWRIYTAASGRIASRNSSRP